MLSDCLYFLYAVRYSWRLEIYHILLVGSYGFFLVLLFVYPSVCPTVIRNLETFRNYSLDFSDVFYMML